MWVWVWDGVCVEVYVGVVWVWGVVHGVCVEVYVGVVWVWGVVHGGVWRYVCACVEVCV